MVSDTAMLATAEGLLDAGQADRALMILSTMSAADQDNDDWQELAGRCYADQGDWAIATRMLEPFYLDRARRQRFPAAMNSLGMAYIEQGKIAAAVSLYLEMADWCPDPVVFANLGQAFLRQGKPDKAEQAWAVQASMQPDNAEPLLQIGFVRQEDGRMAAAEEAYRSGLALDPDNITIANNLANLLAATGRQVEALQQFEAVLAAAPDYADALHNYGLCHWACGNVDAAEQAYEKALLHADGDFPQVQLGLAFTKLIKGNYRQGLPEMQARFATYTRPPALPAPVWQGSDIRDRHLLVWCEQGFGDCLQFIRFLPAIRDRAAKVTLWVQPGLMRLLEGQPVMQGINMVSIREPAPAHDCWVALLDLAMVLDVSPDHPADLSFPYIHAGEPDHSGQTDKLVAGFVWSGNPEHKNDHNRSMTLPDLLPLIDCPVIEPVSLQLKFQDALPDGMTFLLDGVTDFADTAARINNLDLVVTVDTAIAHLAAAMNIPVAVMIAKGPDWRWGVTGQQTFWYPSMRLYRQTQVNDWSSPVDALLQDIKTGTWPVKESS